MSFLSPLALIGLALVSLPVVIHLLARRRAARLDFPTLRHLRETPSFRLRPRRIQQPLLLALRVMALVLLILGIARPLITLHAQSSPVRLIMIDASLSMRAPGRTSAAKEEARALINKLAKNERAAVISCGAGASVLAAATDDRQQLLAAVERYEPGGSAIDFNDGFALAASLLGREAPGAAQVDLISDFQQANLASASGLSTQIPARVITHAVGAAIERNAFLLDEAVWKNESGLELSASEIIAAADGRSGARLTWTLDTSAGKRPGIIWRTEAGGELTGSMSTLTPDDFDVDDERFFAFMPPRVLRVLLVEADAETSLYSGTALEAAANNVDTKHSLLTRQQHLPASAAELNSYALVALTLHGALRADELRLLTEYVNAGGTVWLSLARDADVAALNALAGSLEGSVLPFKSLARLSGGALNPGPADLAAPPLSSMTENAFAALRAVKVHEGYALEPRAGADTLMRWNNGTAAFVSAQTGGGRFLLLGTSAESAASELGRSPAFPALAFSLLREAGRPREQLSYALGEAVDLGLAPETRVKITDNAGRVAQATARDLMQRPLSVLAAPGIYRVESKQGVRFLALNTPGPESERALAEPDEVQRYFDLKEPLIEANAKEWRDEAERGGDTWRYFLGAAFVLLVTELFIRVYQRSKRQEMAEANSTP